ncbi:MAG: hypothetical protein WBO92_01280 [Candidatus Moraniibacteriota bacterium]
MKLSTQTILILGLVQCIILTLVLILFFRYQHSLESARPDTVPETNLEVRK